MQDMNREEIKSVLAGSRLGHLGLAEGNRAYVLPLLYAYDGRSFYFHTRVGAKGHFLHATEEACFAITRARSEDDWESVLAFGHVREVTDTQERNVAVQALMALPLPPEWGFTQFGEPRRGYDEMRLLRLTPTRISGRKSEPPGISREERELALGGM